MRFRNRFKKKRSGLLAAAGLAAGALMAACSAAARSQDDSGHDHPEQDTDEADSDALPTRVPRSAQVDLGAWTPDPEQGTDPVVQPAPGAANPAVRLVQMARQSLAAQTGRDIAEMELVSVEEVDWPDSSLGCPQGGRMYLQVITPGYRITLALEGVAYRFHTDRAARVVRCPGK